MALWYYSVKGSFYALGPVEASSAKEARKKIRAAGERPLDVWETSREAQDAIVRSREEHLRDLKGTERAMMADI